MHVLQLQQESFRTGAPLLNSQPSVATGALLALLTLRQTASQ